MEAYIAELNRHAASLRAEDAVKQAQQAKEAAERARFTSLDARLKRLLDTIPLEVQDAGLSIIEVQRMLRPP